MAHSPPFFLLLFFLSFFFFTTFADDAAIMSELLKSLSPTPTGWSSTTPYCKWKGIKCDSSNRVTTINLASNSLAGTLPSDLNSLTQLTSLSLQNNVLSGPLPSFSNLTNLQTLYLDSNNFTSIPNACFNGLTSLQTLSLTTNVNLEPWTIPTELTQSSNLIQLDLGTTNLIGSLPDVFDSFPGLQSLRLSYNNLSGVLPKTFGGSSIQNLWLNNQNDGFGFSGPIDVLSSMTHLNQVWLHKNGFTGSIPDLSNCTSLFDLQLRDNQLTGVVPSSLMGLSSLKNVSLDNNMLQGPFPVFGKGVQVTLEGINSFCLSNPGPCDPRVTTLLDIAADFGYPVLLANSWTGNDPCQKWGFVVCAGGKIITVNLSKQNLNGTISPAFANLTDLRNLYLSGNNLTGSIPGSLANLAQLEVLDVSNNNLSGDVPKFSSKVKFNAGGNVLLGHSGGGGGANGTSPSTGSGEAPSGSPSKAANGSSLSPGWIAGIAIIAVFFVAVVLFVFCKCYAKNRHRKFGRVSNPENGKGEVKIDLMSVANSNGYGGAPSDLQSQGSERSELPVFDGGNVTISIQVLRQVTNNFSEDNILGRGGFGVVYKGELHVGIHRPKIIHRPKVHGLSLMLESTVQRFMDCH